MHGWVKITPLQNTKIIFSQNSPAVRFQHQRFRKSEKKNNGFGFGNGPFFLNLGTPERQCGHYEMRLTYVRLSVQKLYEHFLRHFIGNTLPLACF